MIKLLEQVWLRRVLALTLLVGLWEVAARSGAINPFYFPAPSRSSWTSWSVSGARRTGKIWWTSARRGSEP